jgi:hypothetical protein
LRISNSHLGVSEADCKLYLIKENYASFLL